MAFPTGVLSQQTQSTGVVDTLEEVIVTAEKREENLQRTAIAVTAVNSEQLDRVNAQSFYDVGRVAPNIQIGPLTANSVFIRGIGQQQPSIFSDPGAAIYVDGVYRPRINYNSINFGDLRQIEVLHGPQGTLFGKNAVGGALNIITNSPADHFDASAEGQFGSRDRRKFDVATDVPLVGDQLLARASFETNRQDGYVDDLVTGQKLTDTSYYTTRGSLLWHATANFDATLRIDYTEQNQHPFGLKLISAPAIGQRYLTSDYFSENGTTPSRGYGKDSGVSLTLDWKALGAGSLKSITAYRRYDMYLSGDLDGTPIDASSNPNQQTEHFFSQELDYTMHWLDDRLNWTIGSFYMDEKDRANSFADLLLLPAQIQTRLGNIRFQDAESYAAFTQAGYALTEKMTLTAGLRYSVDRKDTDTYAYTGVTPVTNYQATRAGRWTATTPKFTAQYQLSPDAMVYATASEGFKSGGYNGAATTLSAYTAFKPEKLWNYEAGLKSEWFEHRLRANLTGYVMHYSDIQLNNQQNIANGLVITVANAGAARITGGEGEFVFMPIHSLELNALFGINDFKYTSLANVPGVTLSNVLPFSSKYTASAGGQYEVSVAERGAITLRSDYSWLSKTYFDPQNTEATAQGAYGLWSARVTYRPASDRWSVYVYGVNLADKEYHVGAINTGAGGFFDLQQGPPREIGIGLRAAFGG